MDFEEFSPVAFNPHKHHLGFLKQKIPQWKTEPWDIVKQEILLIGTNLMDVYHGDLSVTQILEQVIDFSGKEGLTDAEKLAEWLGHHEYRKIMLSDESLWVVRQGLKRGYFLHIHPANHSPFTVRIRASTLKTVVALRVFGLPRQEEKLHLQTVNHTREKMLGLSPIRNLEHGKGISLVWSLFS
jgi:hypothetical protein